MIHPVQMPTCGFVIKNYPQPDLDACVFNKKLQFGICIRLNESSMLFIHHKMSTFSACEIFIFLSNLIKLTCNAMSQNALQENCL